MVDSILSQCYLTTIDKPMSTLLMDKMELYPHQEASKDKGIEILKQNPGMLLASEVGTGKTAITISIIKDWQYEVDKVTRIVVFAPNAVLYNWKKEFLVWTSLKEDAIQIIKTGKDTINKQARVIIVSYDMFRSGQGLRDQLRFYSVSFIVWDEAHYLKRSLTQASKRCVVGLQFFNTKKRRNNAKLIAITGTPMLNRPIDLFIILQSVCGIIKPCLFDEWAYAKEFCGLKKKFVTRTKQVWDASGASNLSHLKGLLSHVMIRDLKKDVLKDLPEKLVSVINFDLKQKEARSMKLPAEYEVLTDETFERLKLDENMFSARRQLGVIKSVIAVKFIEDMLEGGVEKVVAFFQHTDVGAEVRKELEKKYKVVLLDGSLNSKQKQIVVDEFQEGKAQVFLGQVQAAGTGITLTASSHTVFIEYSWTPAINEQAEGRTSRIGQKFCTNIYYLIANHDLDTKVYEYLTYKKQIINKVIGE